MALSVALIAFLPLVYGSVVPSLDQLPPPCDNEIFCRGELLHTIQMAGLFHDSKTFVDKKLRVAPEQVLGNFTTLMNNVAGRPSKEQLALFISQYFDSEGSEFESWSPSDWNRSPKFLQKIRDPDLRAWGEDLHDAWKFLGRKIKDDVRVNPDLYSMIYVPNPVIVPGGRFREFYYWDSYWIVQGLLISEMHDTVRGMLENFLMMVERYGLVPNGGRVYYETRSQPPMLIPMVDRYVNVTGDVDFLRKNIHLLEKEMNFWLENRTVNIDGHTLARYNAMQGGPRPEAYKEDYETAHNMTHEDRQEFYMNMKTGAESGWDFSSRWYVAEEGSNEGNLTHIRTRYIVPVDLNAFICMDARILSEMYERLGNAEKAEYYRALYIQWRESMNQVLWNDEEGVWLDYDLMNNQQRPYFYPSNVAPLWAGCWETDTPQWKSAVDKVLNYLDKSQALNFPGGIPTSMQHSGQQWDFPNGWPPLQHLLVFGLEATGDPRAQQVALEIAQKWILNNFEAFQQSMPNAMFEKYDVTVVGLPGGGGEYDVQLGFGWTNGIILEILEKYGDRLTSEVPGQQRLNVWPSSTISLGLGASAAILAAWLGYSNIVSLSLEATRKEPSPSMGLPTFWDLVWFLLDENDVVDEDSQSSSAIGGGKQPI